MGFIKLIEISIEFNLTLIHVDNPVCFGQVLNRVSS
jgi:hypothetical protein